MIRTMMNVGVGSNTYGGHDYGDTIIMIMTETTINSV